MGYYITFRSVTFAQRAEKMLQKKNIRAGIMRTPRWMEEQGCGYALKIWVKDIAAVVRLLRENQIQLRRVYQYRGEGDLEEITV